MPRLANPLQEAISQGVLWSPLRLRPVVFLNPADPTSTVVNSSGVYTSLKNLGTLGGSFTAPTVTAGLEPRPSTLLNSTWINHTFTASSGFASSFSYNPIPASGAGVTAIYLTAAAFINSYYVGFARSSGVFYLAMNFGSQASDVGVQLGSQGWAVSTAKQPVPFGVPVIISHRVIGGASGSAQFYGRFSVSGLPSVGNISAAASLSGSVTGTSTGACYAYGPNPAFTNNNRGYSGALLFFSRALSVFDIQRVEGWLAWRYGCPFALSPDHPFKSRPPTN